ncbi:MAG: large-conductance mechanosensitive channel protein MscL [Lachnospiraceae bacterium]|nr:large-conductance mechanosensitive channel protein MscL [Lachnospiraceae bacterium]
MFKEFKEFISKGNVLDMAVGVIIGGAFGKIVTSLVNDIFMPLLGAITGGADFSSKKFIINPAVLDEAGNIITEEAAIKYGSFIQNIVDFLLIAICIFLMTKAVAKMQEKLKKKEEEPVEEEKKPTQEELLAELLESYKTVNKLNDQSEN